MTTFFGVFFTVSWRIKDHVRWKKICPGHFVVSLVLRIKFCAFHLNSQKEYLQYFNDFKENQAFLPESRALFLSPAVNRSYFMSKIKEEGSDLLKLELARNEVCNFIKKESSGEIFLWIWRNFWECHFFIEHLRATTFKLSVSHITFTFTTFLVAQNSRHTAAGNYMFAETLEEGVKYVQS